MRLFVRLVLILFLLLTTYYVLPTPAAAQGEFQTDYKVSYQVDIFGKANVTQQITLKNKTTNFYADKFELKIGSTKIENVKAQDSAGPMETTVNFNDNVTSISVKFNQRVIGIDKTLPWTLSYTSTELSTKSGQIWEVSIPKVADSQDIGTYDATVSVPKIFGPNAYALPQPQSQSTDFSTQNFTFEKDQLTKSGISMSFGEKQVFSFNLKYYLENKNLTTQIGQISLPPDNNYQKIVIEKIDPKPDDVIVDPDGNYLATYKLTPKKTIDILVSGYAEVFSKPQKNSTQTLSEKEKNIYTQPQSYWETDNAWIKDKANELKTPENIYNFVTTYLKYNQNRKQQQVSDYISFINNGTAPKAARKGAARAAQEPDDAICLEFSDLFIALARSAKIPAREIEGYAYTQNERLRPLSLAIEKDVLHSWPQYWDDEQGWVQVDPTWGATSGGIDYFNKMDFNHITFVQKGVNSQSPNPPGTYRRQSDLDKNLVFVSFAQELPQPSQVPKLDLILPPKIISGVPTQAKAIIQNVGNTALLPDDIKLQTDLKITGDSQFNPGLMPPFSKREYRYKIQTPSFFTSTKKDIILSYKDTYIVKSVALVPIYFLIISPNFLAGTSIAILLTIAGLHLYKKFHQKKHKIPGI